MTSTPILYSFRRCPFAMRARMALHVSETTHEHREILLRDKPAAMLAASPKGTVLVLVLPDDSVIDESMDIMRWALMRNDPEQWLARACPDLVARFDERFKHHLDRYKYAERHHADAAEHRAAGLTMLTGLEELLARQSHLGGTARGFADIAIFPFVRQFAGVDPDWFNAQPVPCVRAWLAALIGSTLFERAMVRVARWEPTGD